jgi:predicted Zn-ribbon and HTH transcriptional regulator
MPFSEKLKEEVKRRAHFKCCLCHVQWANHVHHIVQESEGGANDEGNAAPLCGTCHFEYGNNPDMRKLIKQSRDFWYEQCENRSSQDTELIQQMFDRFSKYVATKEDLQNAVCQLDARIHQIMKQPISTSAQLQQISDATAAFSFATSSVLYRCRRCGYSFDSVGEWAKCPQCGFLNDIT